MTAITIGRVTLPRSGTAATPLATLRLWRQRHCERAELRRLLVATPQLIDDIGLRHETVEAEAGKPFWVA